MSQKIKDKLVTICDDQPFIGKAPMVLIYLADCRRWMDCYKAAGAECRNPGMGDLILACEDALIAAQNSVVAAESLGLGSCYIGDILENHEELVELLHLDKYVFPVTMVVYGYPTKQQHDREKPLRFDKKYIVQKDTYSRLPERDLRDMFSQLNRGKDFDFDEYLKAFCSRKYMSDFSQEMTRSVELYLRHFSKDSPVKTEEILPNRP